MINKSLLAASVVGGILGFATVPDGFGKQVKPMAPASYPNVATIQAPVATPPTPPAKQCVPGDEEREGKQCVVQGSLAAGVH